MRKFYFTLCLMAVIGSLMAGPVDQQKAQKVGTRFLSTTALSQKNADIKLDLVTMAVDRDATDYYVFNVSNGEGFVVIAGDDRVRPILAYSTTGKYNPNDVADGFQYTLNGFRNEIQYVREHNLTATPDIVAEWKSVNETGSLNRGGQTRAVVEPLCQTIWNQNYPWNSQCPPCVDTLGNGGHVFAGCAATAMGQVMKFWDWPAVGNGSHSYNADGIGPLTANFGETEYHFELIPLALDSTSSEEEIYYVAQLLYHLGIALDMQYSAVGSGANALSVYTAFQSYFRYTRDFPQINAGDLIPGYGYTNEEWAQMLKDGGLDEHLPVFYTGSDDGGAGGHAFVCDGYDENDYFHFNWGWSGRDDAWCPIGALHTTRYDFNQTNMFIGHIVPENNEYFSRPDSVSKMAVLEEAFDAVTWTNPTTDLNGNTLTDITSVTIRRNFEEIAVLTDVEAGADMEYIDNGLEPGLYEYSIYITNEAGISRTTYRSILVGEKCNIVFQMHDNGGDGWKGAAISIADENFNRLAVVTMTQGSALVVDLPLLTGNLNFIWNSGWYHAYPEYDTDSECSFTIINAQGQTIYTSTGLEEGVFLTYDPCDFDAIDETVVDNGVSVYPNPTNGLLNVNGCGTMLITVSNMLGQTLFETTAEDNTTLDLSSYGQGFYLVRIATENGVMVQKINVRK